jgi:hypothetical protein
MSIASRNSACRLAHRWIVDRAAPMLPANAVTSALVDPGRSRSFVVVRGRPVSSSTSDSCSTRLASLKSSEARCDERAQHGGVHACGFGGFA